MKKTLFVSALAFLSMSAVAVAEPIQLGDEKAALPHFDVPYSDLNLSHPAGAETMMKRITFAANLVCGGKPDIREIKIMGMFRTCIREAKEQAVHQLNAPLVTALLLEELGTQSHVITAAE